MKKWKKFLIPAVCLFLMQSPSIAFAENTVTADGSATVTVEDPANPGTQPEQESKIVVEKGKRHYYVNGVLQKNCWDPSKTYYFDGKGNAYTAPKASGSKKNVIAKKISGKQYCFDRNGRKVTKGIYANAKGTAYYVDKKGCCKCQENQTDQECSQVYEAGEAASQAYGNQEAEDQIPDHLSDRYEKRCKTDLCQCVCNAWTAS